MQKPVERVGRQGGSEAVSGPEKDLPGFAFYQAGLRYRGAKPLTGSVAA